MKSLVYQAANLNCRDRQKYLTPDTIAWLRARFATPTPPAFGREAMATHVYGLDSLRNDSGRANGDNSRQARYRRGLAAVSLT